MSPLLTQENAQLYAVVNLGECPAIYRCCYQALLARMLRIYCLYLEYRLRCRFPILFPPSSPCCWATFARILQDTPPSKEALPMRFGIRRFSPYSQLFQPTIVENLDRKRQRNRITKGVARGHVDLEIQRLRQIKDFFQLDYDVRDSSSYEEIY